VDSLSLILAVFPYVISYFAAGAVLAISALVNGALARDRRFMAALTIILAWPLVVLVAPEIFLRSASQAELPVDQLKESLGRLSNAHEKLPLSKEEAGCLKVVAERGEPGVAYFAASNACEDILDSFWSFNIPPAVYYQLDSARRDIQEQRPDTGIRFSLSEPDWYIGFSNEFMKSITGIDRKVQGRILDAIGKIGSAPITLSGDTIKPLTGDLSGLWRCRVGDDRLVYFPHLGSRRITLICFGPRSKIYHGVPNTANLKSR
jgi:mRNA-degrading endonuclease RelE of RelBE toxin-antitoxin system